jgi:ABC-type lipoprotein export system ATPase subunit
MFLHAVRDLSSTAIVVTHDPRVAAQFDRIVVLRDGRVVDDSHTVELPADV